MGHNSSIPLRRSSSIRTYSNSITHSLYEACRDGDEEEVVSPLPRYSHADLNRQEFPYGGNTCLHVAVANGHDNVVKLLLKYGCYHSCFLNSQNQSAYDLAVLNKESTRLLFLRQDEHTLSTKFSSRFYDQNVTDCFDIVQVEDIEQDDSEKLSKIQRKPSMPIYKIEEEKKHEIEYSASSKAVYQSWFGRFWVNRLHSDEPLDHNTIVKRLNNLFQQININNSDDYIKANDLIKQYEEKPNSIENLLHLYTLETQFYRALKEDCLPLAIPLFIHLPELKERYFKGRTYRGMHMTYEQLLIYQLAMETPGTFLQTHSFSSTSMDRLIAEQFAYEKLKKTEKDLCVLFIFDFPDKCDQAINLSRISMDTPCLSEYENEEEVLILPWTLFEVARIRKGTDEDDIYTIHLNNVILPNKNLLSTFKWRLMELKKQNTKEKKLKFDGAFQKYKTTLTMKN